jgi:hypothetical protein
MDISKELEATKQRRGQAVERLNQVKSEEQQILQELLRLDGAVRLLERLSKDTDTPK